LRIFGLIVEYLSALWGQPETPILRQEVPNVPADAPDDLQEQPTTCRRHLTTRSPVRQVDNKMTKYSWRDLSFNEEVNTQLLEHFCRRGTLDKDPTKPGKSALLQLLLKNMVASGKLVIDRFEEGVPILSRGHTTHVAHVSEDVSAATQADLRVESSQSQSPAQQTPSQLALANARLSKMAYEKATRIAQERTQEAAQEAERIKQDATADSRKAKKAEHYRAMMEKLEKFPPCPKLCRGEECSGIPCKEEEPGFPYSHIDDMVVCHDKAHVSIATRDGCFLFHLWPARKRSPKPPVGPPAGHPAKPPAKNSGGGTSGARHAPHNRGNPEDGEATSRRKRGTGLSGSSSSSLECSRGSSSKATSTTRG
jgi:hypothetical protein